MVIGQHTFSPPHIFVVAPTWDGHTSLYDSDCDVERYSATVCNVYVLFSMVSRQVSSTGQLTRRSVQLKTWNLVTYRSHQMKHVLHCGLTVTDQLIYDRLLDSRVIRAALVNYTCGCPIGVTTSGRNLLVCLTCMHATIIVYVKYENNCFLTYFTNLEVLARFLMLINFSWLCLIFTARPHCMQCRAL